MVRGCAQGGDTSFTLRTRAVFSAEAGSSGTFTEEQQLRELQKLQQEFPEFRFTFRVKRGPQGKSMHARFALFTWPDQQILFWPDRGFDLETRNGVAYGGPIQVYLNPPTSLLKALAED